MHGCLLANGYLNVLYGMRCFVGWKSRDDPGGNGGCHPGVTASTYSVGACAQLAKKASFA